VPDRGSLLLRRGSARTAQDGTDTAASAMSQRFEDGVGPRGGDVICCSWVELFRRARVS
jgi:hypothetical protein